MSARRLTRALIVCVMAIAVESPALAHPAPFSYLDVRLSGPAIEGTLVLHDFDVAHELKLATSDSLLDPATLPRYEAAITNLVLDRLRMNADGHDLNWEITNVRALPARTAIEVAYRLPLGSAVGRLTIHAALFPYDPTHQTFVNVYEEGSLTRQQILSAIRPTMEY